MDVKKGLGELEQNDDMRSWTIDELDTKIKDFPEMNDTFGDQSDQSAARLSKIEGNVSMIEGRKNSIIQRANDNFNENNAQLQALDVAAQARFIELEEKA